MLEFYIFHILYVHITNVFSDALFTFASEFNT